MFTAEAQSIMVWKKHCSLETREDAYYEAKHFHKKNIQFKIYTSIDRSRPQPNVLVYRGSLANSERCNR